MNPKVSILIPTYGQAHCISVAISSALAQDYGNVEVLVADDASPDETADVVATFSDPRLRYFRNPANLGRVANYRRALYELAEGDWVVNLDGDDYFIDPGFVSAAVGVAQDNPSVLIVAAQHRVITTERIIEPETGRSGVFRGSEVVLNYWDETWHFFHLATLYCRPAALKVGFYRMNITGADWESLLRLALRGDVAYLNRVVGVWNLHGDNASQKIRVEDLLSNLALWESVYSEMLTAGMAPEQVARARAANLFNVAYRDLSNLAKKGDLGTVKYMRGAWSTLGHRLALRMAFHPWVWVKVARGFARRIL